MLISTGSISVPTLVGLRGRKETGKDSIAGMLTLLGYKRYGFADGVKTEVKAHLEARDLGGPILPADMETPPQPVYQALRMGVVYEVEAKPTTPLMRKLLQYWGTEYRRAQDPDYWVKHLRKRAEFEEQPIVIADVSFQNEADFIHMHDGVLWGVERLGTSTSDTHASEVGRATIPVDYMLDNSGDIFHLATQIQGALQWCLELHPNQKSTIV